VLAARAPRIPVIDALHDAPDFGIEASGHLLCALASEYPRGSVFAVVDPGVGSKRDAIIVEADGRRFVGPDNGLFSFLWQRSRKPRCWSIRWRPKRLSASFHGRDLFAPVAGALATKIPAGWLRRKRAPDVLLKDEELSRVIYVDHYGNAITGLREFRTAWKLRAGKRTLGYARTFEEAKRPFWHDNSMGLVEIAAPRGSAARALRLKIGSPVAWEERWQDA
jgi:S-adenosylmethionine hydrolase